MYGRIGYVNTVYQILKLNAEATEIIVEEPVWIQNDFNESSSTIVLFKK